MSIRVQIKKKLSADFTLDVEFESDACRMGILGPSGSGKSMTLKCIAGIEKPDAGHIAVDGRILFDSAKKINLRPQQRRVGYLFQNYALFPRMTVIENICAPFTGRRAEVRERAKRWIERFELAGLENAYPAQISGGQQQRTALARMLICSPSAILLDEPFSALDAALREYMQWQLEELLESRESGIPHNAILVTHNRDEVYRLCPAMALMRRGAIIAEGDTRGLFENPRFVDAAKLTGCKNISPVRRNGAHEVFALDWGVNLRITGNPGTITHIGIRAHDFVPACGTGYNEIPVTVCRRFEEPFENALIFKNAAAQSKAEQKELWWKYSKYRGLEVPEKLFFPPDKILLLQENAQVPGTA